MALPTVVGFNNSTIVPALNISALNGTMHHNGPTLDPIFHSFVILLSPIIVLVNGLVIYLFLTKNVLREITNYFLVSLAVSDGLTGLVVIPLYLCCILTGKIGVFFSFDLSHRLTAFATVYHLLVITCDRYIAISCPFRHNTIITHQVSVVLLIVVWCASLFLPLIQLAWYDVHNLADASPAIRQYELRYNITSVIMGFLLPVILMIFAYTKMLTVVTRHARAIQATTRERAIISKQKRAMIIFATMLLIYIICWFSFFFSSLNADLGNNRVKVPDPLRNVLFYFRFCTSVFNPLLYVFFKSDFRKALRETCAPCNCRRNEAGFRMQRRPMLNNEDDSSPPSSQNLSGKTQK